MTIEPSVSQMGIGIQSGGVDSILAGLWRKVLADLEVDDAVLLDRIDRYSKKVTEGFPERAAQIRGNLRTDVYKDAMTWYTFTKCLRVLSVEYFEIDFTLKHLRSTTMHRLKVKLDDSFFIDEKENDEKDPKEPTVLSVFFNEILHQLNVGVNLFEALLEQYMRRAKVTVNVRNRTHIRGYLKKDFSAPKMSWKSFVKGMIFLCVLEMDMKLVLHHRKNYLTAHDYRVILSDVEDYIEELNNGEGI